MANCATEPADADAALAELLDTLDDAVLAELFDALDDAALDELPDAALDADDACDEPQPQSPSANVAANATTVNTFLPMIEPLSPGVLQTFLPPSRNVPSMPGMGGALLRHRERTEQLVNVKDVDPIAGLARVRISDKLKLDTRSIGC